MGHDIPCDESSDVLNIYDDGISEHVILTSRVFCFGENLCHVIFNNFEV